MTTDLNVEEFSSWVPLSEKLDEYNKVQDAEKSAYKLTEGELITMLNKAQKEEQTQIMFILKKIRFVPKDLDIREYVHKSFLINKLASFERKISTERLKVFKLICYDFLKHCIKIEARVEIDTPESNNDVFTLKNYLKKYVDNHHKFIKTDINIVEIADMLLDSVD